MTRSVSRNARGTVATPTRPPAHSGGSHGTTRGPVAPAMAAFVVLVVMLAAAGLLGYVAGRRSLEDHDPGWIPPERRRWRP